MKIILNVIFNNKTMESITKSFGARFGTAISSRQGIVQDLNRAVMLGTSITYKKTIISSTSRI